MSTTNMSNTPESQIEFPIEESLQIEGDVLLLQATSLQTLGEATSTLSLPAALCDDRLLEEIKSIPHKMGFKIGEVADMLGIKQYVLRYWETEFEVLKPKKAANNQRYFTRKDVENAYLIRKLLHRDRFSIEGARSAMRELKNFVKKENRKDRDWSALQSQVSELLEEIHSLRRLFT